MTGIVEPGAVLQTRCGRARTARCGTARRGVERRLHQHGLRRFVHRRRDEAHLLGRDRLARVSSTIRTGQADAEPRRLLHRHVDVRPRGRCCRPRSSASSTSSRGRRRAPGCRRRRRSSAPSPGSTRARPAAGGSALRSPSAALRRSSAAVTRLLVFLLARSRRRRAGSSRASACWRANAASASRAARTDSRPATAACCVRGVDLEHRRAWRHAVAGLHEDARDEALGLRLNGASTGATSRCRRTPPICSTGLGSSVTISTGIGGIAPRPPPGPPPPAFSAEPPPHAALARSANIDVV